MRLEQHCALDFAEAIGALMPPGVVWEWGREELARARADSARLATLVQLVDADDLLVVGGSPAQEPGGLGWALMIGPALELARVDAQAQPLLDAAVMLHKPKAQSWRLADYRQVAALVDPATDIKTVRPFEAGKGVAGGLLWSERARYVLVVGHWLDGVAAVQELVDALDAFRQLHAVIFVLRRHGALELLYAQN